MKKFVISYINWFDNELVSEIVLAEDLLEATKYALCVLTSTQLVDWPAEEISTIEAIKQEAFNCDGMVNAIEVD